MKYALEYDPIDPNTLTIHFDVGLIEIFSASPRGRYESGGNL